MSVDNESHPIRFLFKLLIVAGVLAALGKFLTDKRHEYAGLTETEARSRMEAKLAARFGEDKATEIADQVIPVLADRGLFKAEAGI